MRDLHVDARRLCDGDRLADRLADAVGLVADVRRVGGAVAAEHPGQRVDLRGVRVGAGRGEEAGGESPRAGGQRLRQQALHGRQFLGGERAILHPRGHEPQRVVPDLQDDVERRRRKGGDIIREAGLAERQPGRAGREIFAEHRRPSG